MAWIKLKSPAYWITLLIALASCGQYKNKTATTLTRAGSEKEWPVYGGNAAGNRYFPAKTN